MSTNKFKIALIQMKVGEDKTANLAKAKKLILESIEQGDPELIVLPEFFNSPYGLPFFEKYAEEEENSETLDFISSLAKETKKYIIAGSMPTKVKKEEKFDYYNTCFAFDREGEIVAKHNKVHLFDIDIPGKISFKESEILSPGNSFTTFETDFCNIGLGICYDIRFPEYSQILKKEYDVDLMVFPSAFNTVTGPLHWDLLMRARALDNNVHFAMCSPARNIENPKGYQAWGHSQVFDPMARLIATTEHEEDIVIAEVDLQKNRDIEAQIPTWMQKRNDLYGMVSKSFSS